MSPSLSRSATAFDATDPAALERFFRDLPKPVDHVMVTAGRPTYGKLVEMDLAQARRALDDHLWMVIQVARARFSSTRSRRERMAERSAGRRATRRRIIEAGRIKAPGRIVNGSSLDGILARHRLTERSVHDSKTIPLTS